jgi:hypothetical protein
MFVQSRRLLQQFPAGKAIFLAYTKIKVCELRRVRYGRQIQKKSYACPLAEMKDERLIFLLSG